MKNMKQLITISIMSSLLFACGNQERSFSILAEQETFKQTSKFVQPKIDILWVVDNSGSMLSSQQAVANNFRSFIQHFQSLDYDFQMAFITTDAFATSMGYSSAYAKFKDGSGSNKSGVFVLNNKTPDLENVFVKNIMLGTSGLADERAFSSIKTSLTHSVNANMGFRRQDAVLAIVIVSDEDDFSHDTTQTIQSYTDSRIHKVSTYLDFLDTYTASNAENRKYTVSSIAINDEACRTALGGGGRKVSLRYEEMVTATKGVRASLCEEFTTSLDSIAENILDLASVFSLSRIPRIETIRVVVNGTNVPQNTDNGWSYREADNSIMFHGTFKPPKDSDILVDFDPVSLE